MKFSAVTLRSCKNSEARLKAAEKSFNTVIYHKPKRLVRRWTDPPQEVNKPLIITSAPPWVDDKQQTVCCTVTYCIFHCVESMFASGTWFLVSTNKLLVFACLSSHEHEMKRKLNVSLCNRGGLMSSFLLPESISFRIHRSVSESPSSAQPWTTQKPQTQWICLQRCPWKCVLINAGTSSLS